MEKVGSILRSENVIKRYPIGDREIEILHGLTAEIMPGEFVMLIGPSGCGKSTYMYTMFGLEAPTGGKVFFKGTDLFTLTDNERTEIRSRSIAMVHQQPIWIKSLTVKENIAFPLFLHRAPRKEAYERANHLLEVLNLGKLGDHHPHELSVGEQQRCSFMRSLITNPEIVFADEPTGSLDTDSSIVVMELFKKINEQLGKTIVMVTHNLNHLPYASKIISMLDGKIVKVEEKRPPSKVDNKRDILEVISSWKQVADEHAKKDDEAQKSAVGQTHSDPETKEVSTLTRPETEIKPNTEPAPAPTSNAPKVEPKSAEQVEPEKVSVAASSQPAEGKKETS